MLVPDRRRRMLDLVEDAGSARVVDLARQLGISEWTVRRDLDELERQGRLVRARGGALAAPRRGPQVRVPEADGEQSGAKQRIAREAARHLDDGSTIMLLAGSTVGALVPHLAERTLTVVTNGLEIAHELRHAPGISLVVLGGYLHRQQMTLLGPMSEQAMQGMHVDVMIAGAFGVDAELGVTGNKIIQAGYHSGLLRHTNSLMVLADSSKLGRRGPTLLAPPDAIDTLVTDALRDEPTAAAISAAGARVLTAR